MSEALQTAIETGGEYAAEFRIVLPDGSMRWVQGRGRALTDAAGTAVRLLGAGYDTTGGGTATRASPGCSRR